ncbi:TlpA disulfide reductase family protein [Neoroseomonas lacus]|uniref:Thioredoxin domain-containing protein n=1 Tax=Neoroseomonas lacus TaxID=287609 RepID=A0A917KYZ7_9PROT|nr:TlpA disulfide reductase family protein [Neoroseomonas lacus]GGJ36948.1 hypothetical protein GCM10011320_50750 [Neoroseomonas lacus]
MLVPTRRSILKAAPAVATGGTLLAALRPRQGLAASPNGLSRLRESTEALPAITFTDAEGKDHAPADFGGKGLVINLWATWCPPCVAEMPALDRTAAALAGDDILVLPISSDRGGLNTVQGFYERTQIRTLRIWLDPRGAAARALGARGLPTTVIVDRQGRERARVEGDAAWDAPEFLATIRRLVGPVGRPAETLRGA